MKHFSRNLTHFICFFLIVSNSIAQSFKSDVDAMVTDSYSENTPGISILVAKNGKAIYKNTSGYANMELEIPIKSENVFEIGSITKQFTVIAILMLEEQG